MRPTNPHPPSTNIPNQNTPNFGHFQEQIKYNPSTHHCCSIRLKGYDYSQPGAYFLPFAPTIDNVGWLHVDCGVLMGDMLEGTRRLVDVDGGDIGGRTSVRPYGWLSLLN